MAARRLNRINIVLAEIQFTQTDLSVHLGVDLNTISRWCRNINQPDLATLYEIASFFRIDIRDLVEPTSWEQPMVTAPYLLFLERKAENKTELNKPRKRPTHKKKGDK